MNRNKDSLKNYNSSSSTRAIKSYFKNEKTNDSEVINEIAKFNTRYFQSISNKNKKSYSDLNMLKRKPLPTISKTKALETFDNKNEFELTKYLISENNSLLSMHSLNVPLEAKSTEKFRRRNIGNCLLRANSYNAQKNSIFQPEKEHNISAKNSKIPRQPLAKTNTIKKNAKKQTFQRAQTCTVFENNISQRSKSCKELSNTRNTKSVKNERKNLYRNCEFLDVRNVSEDLEQNYFAKEKREPLKDIIHSNVIKKPDETSSLFSDGTRSTALSTSSFCSSVSYNTSKQSNTSNIVSGIIEENENNATNYKDESTLEELGENANALSVGQPDQTSEQILSPSAANTLDVSDTKVDEDMTEEDGYPKTEHFEWGDIDFDSDQESLVDEREEDAKYISFQTKPNQPKLDEIQIEYCYQCQQLNLVPNSYIMRDMMTTSLSLVGQQLGPHRIKALCVSLINNPYVTELKISEEEIDNQTMQYIAEMMGENDVITELDLSDNNMGRDPVYKLIKVLETTDSLTNLDLAGNELVDTDGDIFVTYLTEASKLEYLHLGFNSFSTMAPQILGKALTHSCVTTLSLRWNHIRELGCASLIDCLCKNDNITTLDLSWNGLGELGTKYISKLLRINQTISALNLSANRFTAKMITEIMNSLQKNQGVHWMAIGDNILTARDLHAILYQLKTVKGNVGVIKTLDFGNHSIDFDGYTCARQLLHEKDIMVMHGEMTERIDKQKQIARSSKDADIDLLASLEPITVLMEFSHMLDMEIKELFDYLDDDGSGSLTHDEFKDGLLSYGIPLPDQMLMRLIRKMDLNGDGEISFEEMMQSKNKDNKDKTKILMTTHVGSVDKAAVQIIICRKVLERLMGDKLNNERDKKKKKDTISEDDEEDEDSDNDSQSETEAVTAQMSNTLGESGSVQTNNPDKSGSITTNNPDKSGFIMTNNPDKSVSVMTNSPDKSGSVMTNKPDTSGSVMSNKPEKSGSVLTNKPDKSVSVLTNNPPVDGQTKES